MPLIEPDYSEAVDLGAGTYNARVVDYEVRESKATGKPYLNWKLEVIEHEDTRLNGRTLFTSTPISGRGAGILKSFLKALTGEIVQSFDPEDMKGRELTVDVVQNDRGNPEVKRSRAKAA